MRVRREPKHSAWIHIGLRERATAHEIVVRSPVLIGLRAMRSGKLMPPLSDEDSRMPLDGPAVFEVIASDRNRVLDARERACGERPSGSDALIVDPTMDADGSSA